MKYRKPKYVDFISMVLLVGVVVLLGACSSDSQDQDIKYKSEEKIISIPIDLDVKTRMMIFDEIEWLTEVDDLDRINELGLDIEQDFPNGYYIYNEKEEKVSLNLADNVKIYIVNFDDLTNPKESDIDGLSQRIGEYEAPYYLTIKDGQIVEIFEQYRP